jgi:hypothetical protein
MDFVNARANSRNCGRPFAVAEEAISLSDEKGWAEDGLQYCNTLSSLSSSFFPVFEIEMASNVCGIPGWYGSKNVFAG